MTKIFVYFKAMVFNLGYAYPREYAKTYYGVREIKIRPQIKVLACQKQAQSSH
jgi:hypothetical protein